MEIRATENASLPPFVLLHLSGSILGFLGFFVLANLVTHPADEGCDNEDALSNDNAAHTSEAHGEHEFLNLSHGATSIKPGSHHPHR